MQIIRGDDVTIPITVKNADQTAYNLTGCTVYFTVRKGDTLNDATDTSATIQKQAIITNAVGGLADIVLTNVETDKEIGEYIYDIQIVTGAGKKSSTGAGIFYITQDVTKA